MVAGADVARADALLWAVRGSFLTYVRGVGGLVALEELAWQADDERFAFPLHTIDTDVLQFRGVLRMQAHAGLLDVEVRDPWVRIGEGSGALTAELKGAPGRSTVADLQFAVDGSSAKARLNKDGCFLFDFTYPPGAPLDDIHFPPALRGQTARGHSSV